MVMVRIAKKIIIIHLRKKYSDNEKTDFAEKSNMLGFYFQRNKYIWLKI